MKISKITEYIYICILLPITLNFFVYFGYITNYTKGVFSINSFLNQYDNGIYRYRILGKFLLLRIYEKMPYFNPGKLMYHLDDNFSQSLYNSYYILNTFFFCGTLTIIYAIFSEKNINLPGKERKFILVITSFVIAITQYTVTPYDLLSYFFLCLAMYIVLSSDENTRKTVLISIVVFFATITRETSAIILSFYGTIYIIKNGFLLKKEFFYILPPVLTFLVTYLLLRMEYGTTSAIYNTFTMYELFKFQNIISIIFFLIFILLLNPDRLQYKNTLIFLSLSSPYLLTIFLTGILFESRLWIPLILPIIILTSLKSDRHLGNTPVDPLPKK